GPPRTELKEKSSPARAPGLRSRALNSVIGSNAVATAPEQREFRPSFGSDLTRNLSRLLDDAVARILFAQGNQQGLHLPAVVLDDRDHVVALRVGHADAVDDQIGHFVAIVCRVELPIDPDRRRAVDPSYLALHDEPFPIGLA